MTNYLSLYRLTVILQTYFRQATNSKMETAQTCDVHVSIV